MTRKWKENGGFTMVEMLCTVAILVMLCLLVSAGFNMAMRSYRDVTAESEAQLLLNDLSNALADKLRYAIVTVKQKETETGGVTTDKCDFSLENVTLENGGNVKSVWKSATTPGGTDEEEGWIKPDDTSGVANGDEGIVMVGTKQLLTTGAYGGGDERTKFRRYKVTNVDVKWYNIAPPVSPSLEKPETYHNWNDLREGDTIIFYITLEVKDRWGGVSESTDLTVRCLNPVKREE